MCRGFGGIIPSCNAFKRFCRQLAQHLVRLGECFNRPLTECGNFVERLKYFSMCLRQNLRVDCGLGRHLLDARSLRRQHIGIAHNSVLGGLLQSAKLLQNCFLHA